MNRAVRLRRLKTLTKLNRTKYEGELSNLNRQESDLQSTLVQINHAFSSRAAERARGDDVARMAAVDTKWQAWVEQRRVSINQEIASLRVEIDQAEQRLRAAFGQDEALEQVTKQQALQLRKTRQRAEDYES